MYLFASEVGWGTSELTLFQKATTTTTKKQSSQEICHQMLTLLLDQDTIYILKYFCMRYFMNIGMVKESMSLMQTKLRGLKWVQ